MTGVAHAAIDFGGELVIATCIESGPGYRHIFELRSGQERVHRTVYVVVIMREFLDRLDKNALNPRGFLEVDAFAKV